jgi:hypothetical protein
VKTDFQAYDPLWRMRLLAETYIAVGRATRFLPMYLEGCRIWCEMVEER